MGFLEERLKARRQKRNQRLKVFVLILILFSIVAGFYFSASNTKFKYKKSKPYGDWSTFQDKKRRN